MSLTKIVTFNIRNPWNTDGINSFMHRAGLVYDKVMTEMPRRNISFGPLPHLR